MAVVSRGHDRERDVREWLEERGWWVARAAGSLGDADLVACRASMAGYARVRLVEVKSTHRGPFHGFGPADRVRLADAARLAGAEAWLAWWPPCKPGQRKADALRWIPAAEWPS